MSVKLDNLDLKILDIISQDARIPLSEVAERCGVSRAVVHQRVGTKRRFWVLAIT